MMSGLIGIAAILYLGVGFACYVISAPYSKAHMFLTWPFLSAYYLIKDAMRNKDA